MKLKFVSPLLFVASLVIQQCFVHSTSSQGAQDAAHGIRIGVLGIDLKVAKGGTSELAVTANKTGDYVGHCSVFCGTGNGSMKPALHVAE
jgi:heme/copper-type cytochrome/quinol oxidase subunit 2